MDESLPTELSLEVVTPDRLVAHDSVTAVTLPGKDGYLGILPGHRPLLTEIAPGELTYTRENVQHHLAVTWGFAEVLPDRVIVLAECAERAEEIDVARAERARQRAEERLRKISDPQIDQGRAREALRRAIARLETARHAGA
ncbi:MAG TPA: F0F1 ATP synthase subunit epsilon [Terriglobia bacterium]|jgi:F-type H+-transporting ATPase subunit epsilon|nr:F0F1 ATP synthase subunit epsilon [Terriglobia bacterium]